MMGWDVRVERWKEGHEDPESLGKCRVEWFSVELGGESSLEKVLRAES